MGMVKLVAELGKATAKHYAVFPADLLLESLIDFIEETTKEQQDALTRIERKIDSQVVAPLRAGSNSTKQSAPGTAISPIHCGDGLRRATQQPDTCGRGS